MEFLNNETMIALPSGSTRITGFPAHYMYALMLGYLSAIGSTLNQILSVAS